MLLATVVLAVLGAGLLAGYVAWSHAHWRRRGVRTLKTTPLLGSLGDALLRRKATADVIKDLYLEARSRGLRFAGMFVSTQPFLLLADPDLIRLVTVTHFHKFTDRRPFAQKSVDELLSRSLLSLRGEEWREMRHHLSPAFTGSKLRGMMELMEHSSRQFVGFLAARADPEQPIEMRENFRRFAADVIASTAFGTVSDSSRPDMIQLLVDGRKKKGTKTTRDIDETLHTSEEELLRNYAGTSEISDLDIVAQAFTFFLGGFETVSTALSFAALALAVNPAVQERLREEVDAAFEGAGGTVDYPAVQGLKYMDMFLAEVLRMFPVVPFADRACTEPLDLPEFGLKLRVGDSVGIPHHGLHHDPRFFPEPERFDPERFSEANKHNIRPFTYLPFGAGPRNCIGMRFAQLEVKLAIAYLVATCDLRPCALTRLPLRLDPARVDNAPVGGFQLFVRPRDRPSARLTSA